jgi:hypothetical protein
MSNELTKPANTDESSALAASEQAREVMALRLQALNDFLETCLCTECGGSGRTSNHVTGEVECDECLGTGHDSRKAFARAEQAEAERDEIERKYREQLWLGHGHTGLYGDDGERQCNHRDCMIDFKRWPLERIEERLDALALKRLGEAQSSLLSAEARGRATCAWTPKDGGALWNTACGHQFAPDGDLDGFHYCYACGGTLITEWSKAVGVTEGA